MGGFAADGGLTGFPLPLQITRPAASPPVFPGYEITPLICMISGACLLTPIVVALPGRVLATRHGL